MGERVHTVGMLAALLISAAAATAPPQAPGAVANTALAPAGLRTACESSDPAEVVVCGRPNERYRIDRSVLDAMRAREVAPSKPDANSEAASASTGCIGPAACRGDALPLVAVALKTLEAATLAAKGDDWREAFRTQEDEYRLYLQAKERRERERRPKIGFEVRN